MSATQASHPRRFSIEPVASDELTLAAVLDLASRNRRTLGFLPNEAFRQRAERGTLLIARSAEGTVAGYALVDRTKRRLALRHLCVNRDFQSQGAARELVNAIVERWPDAPGIGLLCRWDWPASKLWPQLGFVPVGERPGRGVDGGVLIEWWRPLAARGLFDWTAGERDGLPLVADLNVLLDLFDPTRNGADETQCLIGLAAGDIELLVTNHLHVELTRSSRNRAKQRSFVSQYRQVPVELDDAGHLHRVLLEAAEQHGMTDATDDLMYIAEAASAGLPIFVTRDSDARRALAGLPRDLVDVEVLTPTEVVLRAEELRDSRVFRPAQLLDTELRVRSPRAGDEPTLIDIFLRRDQGERRSDFSRLIRRCLAEPQTWNTTCVIEASVDRPLALVSWRRVGDELHVDVLRILPGTVALSLARQLAFQLREVARRLALSLVQITEAHCGDITQAALGDEGFVSLGHDACCPVLVAIGPAADLDARVAAAVRSASSNGRALLDDQWLSTISNRTAAELESRLWPLKITDAPLPNYVIPIRPAWAAALFDVELSSETLFSRPLGLGMSRDHAYYRSARPAGLVAPARILWYVSQAGRACGAGAIRACSQLQEVMVGTAREVFGRNKHLGVYGYSDVAGLERNGKVMGLRFGQTERFDQPVTLRSLQDLAKDHDTRPFLQGPWRVDSDLFADIYNAGFGTRV